ncbi:vomeronasal type-1 receptor 1-like [Lontra canadensis]|uniref:vomeronasal type-1 receptor 1-like n=1 Tax=Lontra canadensis TaxID=76717 RepID=UPI0013F2F226|nr:vomeronasal type-1 receptor 1-like [Lontra canadensis]
MIAIPLDTDAMGSGKLELGIIFVIHTGVGILGNSSLLCLYTFSLLTGHKLRPTDLILNQLVLANSVVLFSKGIPQTMVAFGSQYFLNDATCKLIFYCYRVSTGVSFHTLCLLNGYQVIKLNPSICRWAELKIRSPKFIGFCCFLCWILHLLINSFILVIMNGPSNSKNLSVRNNGQCSWNEELRFKILNTVTYFFLDFLSLGFMVWASSSMIFILFRHKQQVQHIHNSRLGPRTSHEARATCTILVLVSFFATFYAINAILAVWMIVVANPGQWKVNSTGLLSSCFPVLSPFVLMVKDTRVSQFCFVCRAKTNCCPNLVSVL